jgi:uncharacterized iron-regulated protein
MIAFRRTAVLIILIILCGCSSLPAQYIDLHSGIREDFNRVLEMSDSADVIFAGELHADEKSHALQYELIRHLNESGRDVVIAFELFPASEQSLLDAWIDGTIDRRSFIARYQEIVNLPYDYYGRILDYARARGIRVVGINGDREMIAAVSTRGLDAVEIMLPEDMIFSPCSDEPEYAQMYGFSRGRTYHGRPMEHLCDGQRLRDSIMAYNIAGILDGGEHAVVVMAGMAHSMRVAVPDMLRLYTDAPMLVILPDKVRMLTRKRPDTSVADVIWR